MYFRIDLENPMWDFEYENFRDEQLIAESEEAVSMDKANNWILTDDDSYQYAKKVEDGCYELIEIGLMNPEEDIYVVCQDVINVDEYLKEEREKTGEILYSYGYGWPEEGTVCFDSVEDSIAEVQKIYGDNASQIIAECIFEYRGLFHSNILFKGSEKDCLDFIANYIQSH